MVEAKQKRELDKKTVGEFAAQLVKDGMVIGLGTGSTTAYAIKKIGERIKEEKIRVLGVATSHQTEILAASSGIPITTLAEHSTLDLTIDSADQVDRKLQLIKGGGAAHTKEKIIALSSKRFIVIVDESKVVKVLNRAVPLEVIPFARVFVEKQILKLGGKPSLRIAAASEKAGPIITDNGNFIIDADFGEIHDAKKLEFKLNQIAGIVENGLFTMDKEVYVGRNGKVIQLKK